jgi:hypothetical protein
MIHVLDASIGLAQLGGPHSGLETAIAAFHRLTIKKQGEPVGMGKFVGLGVSLEIDECAGHALEAKFLELVEGGMVKHGVSSMEVSGAADVGVVDRRPVRGPFRFPAIEIVPED